ncbi:MAG: hypothetical protein HYU57_05640 [Micavibrio aeruginosavorus]|nr:hypothetical protein [Micavibrio aeruginosavorus]
MRLTEFLAAIAITLFAVSAVYVQDAISNRESLTVPSGRIMMTEYDFNAMLLDDEGYRVWDAEKEADEAMISAIPDPAGSRFR